MRKVRVVNADRRRRSVRLLNYDYGQAGAYFVTICTHNRQLLFEHAEIQVIAERCWLEIPNHFPVVVLDEWVVMPNHVHGIIVIADRHDDACHRRGVQLNAPTNVNANRRTDDNDNIDAHRDNGDSNALHRTGVQLNAPTSNNNDHNGSRDSTSRHSLISPHRNTLAVIVRTYKAAVTTFCRKGGHPDFQWQRNYYERVIRDAAELHRVRRYISDNPVNWNQDEHHAS
jgi:putative transposase